LSDQKSSYRQIMKATSLFGGVQVFNIIIGIIRSKFLAILLGPAGMGIAGLINSTTGLIASITNFGLGTSAVKNVAEAYASENASRMAIVVAVFKKLVWLTGLLGTIVTFICAPLLSKFTFGNADFTLAFRLVSITLLFAQLSTGQLVLLQGMRQIKLLAKVNMSAAVLGLLFSIPIYYWLGHKGIVPAIIITSIIGLSISIFFASKMNIQKQGIEWQVLKKEGVGMLKMGFLLSLSNLIGLGVAYILSIFIGRQGGVEQVGLYNAGFAILNGYIGMIFAAMATDYFPRLAAIANDLVKSNKMINQQAEIGILIIAPILSIFLVFIGSIVSLLYSSKFYAINSMMQLIALGVFFKMITWCMGYMILAKGNSKLFFISELVANAYTLALNIFLYKMYGLDGIGFAFIAAYILGIMQSFAILKWKYNFKAENNFLKIFGIQFTLAVVCFYLVRHISGIQLYVLVLPIILASTIFTIIELNKRLDVLTFIKSKFKK
jgi:O-antigen/teichoic acid export membrane protein